nr:sulfatase-like hydrolase/transferase [Actinomycetota bacterium]
DHPQNVFTLLGSDYRVEAEELVTRMCPSRVCPQQVPSFGRRMGSLFSDVGLVSAHMLLPEDLTSNLPPVDENWGDFAADDTASDVNGVPGARDLVGSGDPLAEMQDFVSRIAPAGEPIFYFKHVLLPHAPWRYLPEGYEYPQDLPIPGTVPLAQGAGTRWDENAWLAAQGYQRHILQTMAVDRVLGELLDDLQSNGMYEDALVIVVSDHGTSFQPGAPRRSTAPETVGELAPIPMFIKEPGQTSGRVIDDPVRTIDILPTIAALLDADDVWEGFDGRSLTEAEPGTMDRELGFGGVGTPYSDEGTELVEIVERKYEVFGPGDLDPYLLAPPGTRALIGQQAPGGSPSADATATIEEAGRYSDIDLGGGVLPALLRGQVRANGLGRGSLQIAVAVNGTIAAVTETYETTEEGLQFQTMLPPGRFEDGRNVVELYLVERPGRRAVLLLLSQE